MPQIMQQPQTYTYTIEQDASGVADASYAPTPLLNSIVETTSNIEQELASHRRMATNARRYYTKVISICAVCGRASCNYHVRDSLTITA